MEFVVRNVLGVRYKFRHIDIALSSFLEIVLSFGVAFMITLIFAEFWLEFSKNQQKSTKISKNSAKIYKMRTKNRQKIIKKSSKNR